MTNTKTENGITYEQVFDDEGQPKGWLQISILNTPYRTEY